MILAVILSGVPKMVPASRGSVKPRIDSARHDRARLIWASACIDTAETGGLVRGITAL
jgi:hypothetical protein